jgi:hypothetical protein
VKNDPCPPVFLCGYIEERDLTSQDALKVLLNKIKNKKAASLISCNLLILFGA